MPTQVDNAILVAQGRIKAPGIGWSEEERQALKEGVSPEDVRAGILSIAQREAEDTNGAPKRLERLSKAELVDKARSLGFTEFDEAAVTKDGLITEIRQREKGAEPGPGTQGEGGVDNS